MVKFSSKSIAFKLGLLFGASFTWVLADAISWTGNSSTDWSAAGNWDASVPGSSDRAYIDTNSGNMPLVSGVAEQVTVEYLFVGTNSSADSTLTINSGGTVTTDYLRVGLSGGTGLIDVSGAGSELINARWGNHIGSGSGGEGTIRLRNGGKMNNGGLILELGTGSDDHGILEITSAGHYDGKGIDVGRSSGSSGTVLISGNGSQLTTGGTVEIGSSGAGELTLEDNASISVGRFSVADQAGSTGLLKFGTGGAAGSVVSNNKIMGGDGDATVEFNHNEAGFTLATGLEGSLKIKQIGSGTTTLTGASSYTGQTTVSNGRLEFGNGNGAGHVISGNILNNAEVEVDSDGTSIFSGNISGSGSLEKNSSGTLVLSGANTYSGATTVNAGELHIGAGGSSGSIAGDILSDGKVVFNRSDASTYAGSISGSGSMEKSGAGTLTMTGDHTFSGAVDIAQGTLTLDGSFAAGGDVTIFTNAAFNGSGLVERNVVINSGATLGTGLDITGSVSTSDVNNLGSVSSGTQTANSYETLVVDDATGGTIDATQGTAQITTLDGSSVSAGDLGVSVDTMSSGQITSSGGVRVDNLNGGDIEVGSGANVTVEQGTYGGTLSGDGGLVKQGSGTLRLENAGNNQGAATQVWGGTLEVLNLGALGRVPIVRLRSDNSTFKVVNGADTSTATVQVEDPGSSYVHDFTPGGNLGNTATISDGGNTTAKIGAGTSGGNTSVTMSYNNSGRLSLTGLNGTSFLLELTGPLNAELDPSEIYLGWYDPLDGLVKNAVVGNIAEDGNLAGLYSETTWQEFIAANGGYNGTTMLGAYGFDFDSDTVWAIIDHNSEFEVVGVVPEPSAFALLAGLIGLFRAVVRRKRS